MIDDTWIKSAPVFIRLRVLNNLLPTHQASICVLSGRAKRLFYVVLALPFIVAELRIRAVADEHRCVAAVGRLAGVGAGCWKVSNCRVEKVSNEKISFLRPLSKGFVGGRLPMRRVRRGSARCLVSRCANLGGPVLAAATSHQSRG